MTTPTDNSYHTMTLTVIYDENSEKFYEDVVKLLSRKYPLVKLVGIHENTLKGKKKAFQIKGSFGARLAPFALLDDLERNPLKAFYSEASECTIDKIEYVLDSFIVYSKTYNNGSTSN